MATNLTTANVHLAAMTIQAQIEQFSSVNPGTLNVRNGFLDSVYSPANGGNNILSQVAYPGKASAKTGGTNTPRVLVEYQKPSCVATSDTIAPICDNFTESADPIGYMDLDFDLVSVRNGKISEDQFLDIVRNPSDRLNVLLTSAAREILRDLNKQGIDAFYAQSGKYSDGTASVGATQKSLVIADTTNLNALQGGWAEVHTEFQLQESEAPIVVGGKEAMHFMHLGRLGGKGSSLDQAATMGFGGMFTDIAVDTQIQATEGDTASRVIAYTPGTVKMLEHFNYTGDRTRFSPTLAKYVINIDGYDFDYSLYYDECNETWKWQLSKTCGFFMTPTAAFAPCYDFNQRLTYTATTV